MSPSSASNAETIQMLRKIQAQGNLTPQQQQWVTQQIQRLGGQSSTATNLFSPAGAMGALGAAGNTISSGDPRTAGARGIGAGAGALGLGIAALIRKHKGNGQQPDASTLSNNPELYQPDIARQNAQPASPGTGPTFDPAAVYTTPPTVPDLNIPGMRRGGRTARFADGGTTDSSDNSDNSDNLREDLLDMLPAIGGGGLGGLGGGLIPLGISAYLLSRHQSKPAATPAATPGKRRGGRAFAGGGDAAEDLPPAPSKPMRAVLVRKPGGEPDAGGKHFPIPVVSTTIVIAHHKPKRKPQAKAEAKPAKKASGGAIKPRKPAAVPPKKGPGNGAPAPFAKGGHVQVPRGSGCAQRGRKFGGIY